MPLAVAEDLQDWIGKDMTEGEQYVSVFLSNDPLVTVEAVIDVGAVNGAVGRTG